MLDARNWYSPRGLQLAVVDLAFTLAGLGAMGGGMYYGYTGNAAMFATSLGAGLVLLFAATIDRFESLKWLSMEAKTRKLDVTIGKAEVTLLQMRKLTEIAGAALISLSSKSGGRGGPAFNEGHILATDIKSLLISVGSDQHAVKTALKPWIRINSTILVMNEIAPLQRALIEEMGNLDAKITHIELVEREKLEEHGSLVHRKNILSSFLNKSFGNIFDWDFDRINEHINAVVREAPELSNETKEKLLLYFTPHIAQINYLNSELDFQDIDFWRSRMG